MKGVPCDQPGSQSRSGIRGDPGSPRRAKCHTCVVFKRRSQANQAFSPKIVFIEHMRRICE
eukprot:scaffold92449_cov81-Cyclotella_meneghiniana.AAC.1